MDKEDVICIYVCTYIREYMCVCVCIYVYIYVYIYHEILHSRKKECVDLEIILNEVNQRQMSDISYMKNLNKMIQMNLFTNRNRLSDIEKKNKLIFPKGEGDGDKLGI